MKMDKAKYRRAFYCKECICKSCLYYWSGRCPHGHCYDDKRAVDQPYDKMFPESSPRTGWSNWKTDQAYWCRGGVFYPVDRCNEFVEYTGSSVRECLFAMVQVYQDGYIRCSIIDSVGCQECYTKFMEKQEVKDT